MTQHDPEIAYRYLDDEDHAARLLNGHVWLSTLRRIRTMDSIRADSEEAMLTYRPGSVDSEARDEVTAKKMENLRTIGIDVHSADV